MLDFVREHRFVIGSAPLVPFSAEMHYWRVPKARWNACLEAIRDAGFAIVSTCVPWNVHEYREGQFDFDGSTDDRTDLLGFLDLCRKLDFRVILRPGPWICGEWHNGGYPDYLFDYPDIFALDANSQAVHASSIVNLADYCVPSYSNQHFLDCVERYFREFAEDVGDWMYPEGPVFLIQLDNETSWCFRSDAYAADYSAEIVRKLYPKFLEGKHGRIERLNDVYGSTGYQSFRDIVPPREYDVHDQQGLTRYFDWADFKEQQITGYHRTLRDMLVQAGIDVGFYTNTGSGSNYSVPNNWAKDNQVSGLVALDWFQPERYHRASRYFRYLATCAKTVWAGELMAGLWADDPARARIENPVTPEMQKYCILTALSLGMKGANYYMFVERDHWYGSPVTNEGEKTETFEIFKRVNEIANEVDLPSLTRTENISLGVYRPYMWYNYVGADQPFDHVNRLTREVTPQVAATLEHLGYEYSVVDPRAGDSLVKNPILIFGSGAFMDSDTQLRLARFAAKGGTLILYGLPPYLDLWMQHCTTFASAVGIEVHHEEGPALVESITGKLSVYRFGYIEGPEWEPLWEEGDRMVAGRRQLGSGMVLVLAASPAMTSQPELGYFLEQMLGQYDAVRPVRTNVPQVRASLHRNASCMILYLVSTVTVEHYLEQQLWSPIVRFDPQTSGLADRSYVMEDMFTGEKRTVTGIEFVHGIEVPVPTKWGARMFRIKPA